MAKNRDSGVTRTPENPNSALASWLEEMEREEQDQRRNEIDGAESIDQLKSFMTRNYGIEMSPDFDRYDVDAAKAYVQEVSDMMDEFPALKGTITRFGDSVRGKEMGSADLFGHLALNTKNMQSLDAANAKYGKDVKSGLHPEGTNAVNAVSHELGHMLELAVINRTQGEFMKAVAWTSHSVGKDIVASAMSRLPSSSGKESGKPISDISRYATHDASETVAEAVADYRANGDMAKPLSREIWRELKNRLK